MPELTSAQTERRVFVWDAPTRIFHWALLALVVVAWLTGEGEGQAATYHRYAGETIAGLIVFRVVWGFFGGEHARFADFAAGPSAVAAHVGNLFSKKPTRHLGHNPLGGLAVFLLLVNVTVMVATGLFSGGEDNAGPFAGVWGLELSEVHEVAFRVLQALVALHVLGVIVETINAKDGLVPAMITGWKRRRADESGEDARRAGAFALVAALLLGIGASAALMAQPPASSLSNVSEHESGQGGADDD
jgi:cytochrome b